MEKLPTLLLRGKTCSLHYASLAEGGMESVFTIV